MGLYNELCKSLELNITLDEKKKAKTRQETNIKAFNNLNRSGLEYGKIERRLLLKEFDTGEKVYIRYPGKETKSKNPKPYDFRPEVWLNNIKLNDQSFEDIFNVLSNINNKEDYPIIAALLYRCSLLLNASFVTKTCKYEDIRMSDNKVINEGEEQISFWEMDLSELAIEFLNDSFENINIFSPYVFFYMNDLICQNEDCKYYYRETYEKNKKWDGNIGRRNTYLTYLFLITYFENRCTLAHLCGTLINQKGVAKVKEEELSTITNQIIKKS